MIKLYQFLFTLFVVLFSSVFFINIVKAAEPVKEGKKTQSVVKAKQKSAAIIIESRVKGSQEQPNVTYIMPWQGINKPIVIDGKQQKVVMPNFKPINPKNFKKQVNDYHQQKESTKKLIKE